MLLLSTSSTHPYPWKWTPVKGDRRSNLIQAGSHLNVTWKTLKHFAQLTLLEESFNSHLEHKNTLINKPCKLISLYLVKNDLSMLKTHHDSCKKKCKLFFLYGYVINKIYSSREYRWISVPYENL